jgi:hypothetical protein
MNRTVKWKDVEPKDEDGVDGRGVSGWDGWVCGLGPVGTSLIFGLVRGAGAFAPVLPTFVLVSRMQLAERCRYHGHFLSAVSSSRREVTVGGPLVRDSVLCVGLDLGGVSVTSGSCTRPSHSCDGCVCDLVEVGDSSIYGLVRGTGTFTEVFPTFVLASRIQLAQRYFQYSVFFET